MNVKYSILKRLFKDPSILNRKKNPIEIRDENLFLKEQISFGNIGASLETWALCDALIATMFYWLLKERKHKDEVEIIMKLPHILSILAILKTPIKLRIHIVMG